MEGIAAPPPRARSRSGPLLVGVVVAVVVNTLAAAVLVTTVAGWSFSGVAFVPAIGVLLAGTTLTVLERTRFLGLGMLIGFFASLVLAAAAGVVFALARLLG